MAHLAERRRRLDRLLQRRPQDFFPYAGAHSSHDKKTFGLASFADASAASGAVSIAPGLVIAIVATLGVARILKRGDDHGYHWQLC
jgi:hypothetical protein